MASSNRIPKLCHHKATGQGYVTLPGPQSRVIYVGTYGTELAPEKYEQVIAEWLASGRRMPERKPDLLDTGPTINEVMNLYLDWAESNYVKNGSPTGEAANIRLAIRAVRHIYGHSSARKFGPLNLKAVRERMVQSGLCRNECNRRTRIIVRAFRWAVSEELVPESVWAALKSLTGLKQGKTQAPDHPRIKPVDEAQVEAALPFMPPPVAAMVRLQLLTGMRPGEVCSMTMADLDMSDQVWLYRPSSHKTEHHGRERVVPIGPQGQEIIKDWLRADRQAPLFSRVTGWHISEPSCEGTDARRSSRARLTDPHPTRSLS